MRIAFIVLFLGACGSVSSKSDAQQQVDTAALPDNASPDTPAGGVTAISASNITAFSAANGTFTVVPFVSVAYDDLSELSNSTFTPKSAGDYFLCASLSATTALMTIDVFKNGAREKALANGSSTASGCTMVRLVAGDALDVRVYQATGNSLAINPDPNWDWLTISRQPATAYVTSAQQVSLPDQTYTRTPYANEIFDDGSQFNTTTNRFTAAQAGDYQFCASYYLNFAAIPTQMDLYLNNTRESTLDHGVGGDGGCRTLRLAQTDSVEVYLYQSSGAAQTINADQAWDWVMIAKQPAIISVAGLTPFSIPANTFTKVPYTTEQFDDGGEFDVATSTFTPATAGDYRVCAELLTLTTADGDELDIYKNGTREKALGAGQFGVGGCRVMRLVTTDQIQIYARSGQALTLGSSAVWDWFEVSKLR